MVKRSIDIKPFFLVFILSLGIVIQTYSQSFNTGILFNPGVTLSTDYLTPAAIDDSTDFQLTKYKIQVSQPLKTKIGVDLKDFSFKKMDAKASQIFLNYNFSVSQPKLTDNNNFENIYNAGVGITAITASIRKGVWIYSANVFASENENTLTKSFTPNFRAYVANLKTKNFKTFYFYGGGLLVNQGKFIPFPLLGLRTKLSSNLKLEIILPLHTKLNYKFNSKVDLDAVAHFNGINTVYRKGSAYSNNDQTINFTQLKTYLALNTQLGKHYKLKIEGGYSSMQQLYSWENKTSQKIDAAPYVGIAFTYSFGKSLFGNITNQGE